MQASRPQDLRASVDCSRYQGQPSSHIHGSQDSHLPSRAVNPPVAEAMEAEGAAVVRERREVRGFDWAGFFSNRYVLLQILFYSYLFYTYLPGLDEVGPLLAWLLLLFPMCVLNLIGTHKLKEMGVRHPRQIKNRLGGRQLEAPCWPGLSKLASKNYWLST